MMVFAEVEIEATVSQVWEYLTNVDRYPEWQFRRGPFVFMIEAVHQSGVEDDAIIKTRWSDGREMLMFCREWDYEQTLRWESGGRLGRMQIRQWVNFELHPFQEGAYTWVGLDVEWIVKGPWWLRWLVALYSKGDYRTMAHETLESLRLLIEDEVVMTNKDAELFVTEGGDA